jgi:hypothetical protein
MTNNIPSIAPMVKVAANQEKWPFCEPNAFVLTDITYSGAIIFGGSLKLLEKFCIQERRLGWRPCRLSPVSQPLALRPGLLHPLLIPLDQVPTIGGGPGISKNMDLPT